LHSAATKITWIEIVITVNVLNSSTDKNAALGKKRQKIWISQVFFYHFWRLNCDLNSLSANWLMA